MRWILVFFVAFLHADDRLDTAREFLCASLPEDTQFIALPGLTNKSYLFMADGKKYVLRFPGIGTEKFINRDIEWINSKEAHLHGFSPTSAISFDSATGRQLSPFVEGFKDYEFEEFYHSDLMQDIAHLLRKIHTSSLNFENHINLFERMDHLGLYLQQQAVSLPSEYFSLRKILEETANLACFEALPSHGDPVPSNFALFHDKLMLFDWEYSGLADPAYDLAFLSTVMNYSKEQEDELLHYYGATLTMLLKEKIIYFKPLIETWLGLWGILQIISFNESQQDFFKTFSMARFRRAEKILCSKEYNRAVQLLTLFYKKDGRLFRSFPIDSKIPLLASFSKLSDEVGLTQIEFGLWICPYCGILNPMDKLCCICPNCPLK